MKTRDLVDRRLREGAFVKLIFMHRCAADLARICEAVTRALRRGRSVWLIGNGGSAADAQHIAGELEGTFTMKRRRALPVAALTTNTSSLTAIANDHGYDKSFARQVEAHVRRGDVLIAISTSGRSRNILAAVRAARARGAVVVGFTGSRGAALRRASDLCLSVPSDETPRIQECHILAGHVLCEAVEQSLFA